MLVYYEKAGFNLRNYLITAINQNLKPICDTIDTISNYSNLIVSIWSCALMLMLIVLYDIDIRRDESVRLCEYKSYFLWCVSNTGGGTDSSPLL